MIELHFLENDSATAYVCDVVFRRWCLWPVTFRAANRNDLGVGMVGRPDVGLKLECARALSGSQIDSLLARAFAPEIVARLRAPRGESLREVHGVADWLDKGVLSAIFWLLSGQSEIACSKRDSHERVPAAEMLLVKLGILDLPVVDLLAEYLIDKVRVLCPELPDQKKDFKIIPTHDVDAPYKYAFRTPFEFMRGLAADAIQREPLRNLIRAPIIWQRVRGGDIESDPFNCFARILALNESRGLQSEFYFIANHSAGRIDGDYDITHPLMRALLKDVVDRGHIVGLHSSYNAPFNAEILHQEHVRLQKLAIDAGYRHSIDFVRNHYLRFDPIITPRVLAACGFKQDSTLAFADIAGFRRGTCRPYPLWDFEKNQPLDLIERPLIAMECSLISDRYEGLSHTDAALRLNRLKAECRRFGGHMAVLWHNNYLRSDKDFELYEQAIS